jgi:hypothetical protein
MKKNDTAATPAAAKSAPVVDGPLTGKKTAELTAAWSKAHAAKAAAEAEIGAVEGEIARRLHKQGAGAAFVMPDGKNYRAREYDKGPMKGKIILVRIADTRSADLDAPPPEAAAAA